MELQEGERGLRGGMFSRMKHFDWILFKNTIALVRLRKCWIGEGLWRVTINPAEY